MPDALDEDNPEYVGTDEMYRTHAYDVDGPLDPASGEDRVTEEVQAAEADADRNRVQPIATESWLAESEQTTPQPWND